MSPTGSISRCGGTVTPGTTVAEIILADPDLFAFWKFNETSGIVAADSGPNGLDLTALGAAPTWGAPAGPPGETAVQVGGLTDFARTGFTALTTGDFTAEIWVMDTHPSNASAAIFNQGHVIGGNNPGWALINFNLSGDPAPALYADFGGSTEVNLIAPGRSPNVWYYYACTKASNVWRLYVDGAQDPAGTITQASGGFDVMEVGAGFTYLTGRLSYGAVYQRALAASEIAVRYTLYTT